ncbi:MAG: DUF2169 domain-containing protein [Polyangiaceae bacterium]|nr:DUF2169 domain-containing protein [Polyangiaceae bacterium]
MEFRNLTPFSASCFGALDPAGREHRVVVMRVVYALESQPQQSGVLRARVLDEDAPDLEFSDRYVGSEGSTSLVSESDLVPYKPRCDVLVGGSAHAPEGRAATRWTVRLRVTAAAEPRNAGRLSTHHNGDDRRVLCDKTLVVHGPRVFLRTWGGGYTLQPALATTAVPLLYERAFGGSSFVATSGGDGAPLLNEVCFQNPVGCGWRDARETPLLESNGQPVPDTMAAPQIEYPDNSVEGLHLARQRMGPLTPREMAAIAAAEPYRTAGFGPLGKAWSPRLQLAGTYDNAWLEERWPLLPGDFNVGFWNGAPADQQCDYPPPDARIEMLNLLDSAVTKGGVGVVELPGHRAFVLMRMKSGVMLPLPMVTDTVHIDTDRCRVALVHRVSVPARAPVRVLEARFETHPSKPLVSLARDVGQGPVRGAPASQGS